MSNAKAPTKPPADVQAGKWLYMHDNKSIATTPEDLEKLYKAGTIGPHTLVMKTGVMSWTPMSSVAELRASLQLPPPPDDPDAEVWFYLDGSAKQQGPLSTKSLLTFIEEGLLSADTFAWKEGMGQWKRLGDVKEITETRIFVQKQVDLEPPSMQEEEEAEGKGKDKDKNGKVSHHDSKATAAAVAASSASSSSSSSSAGGGDGKGDSTAAPMEEHIMGEEEEDEEEDPGPAEWLYVDNYRVQQGPVSVMRLRKLFQSAKITDLTMVWKDGMENWQRVKDLADLAKEVLVAKVAETDEEKKKKKKKKRKAVNKWKEIENHSNVYVTGLPDDVTSKELQDHFKRAGIIKDDLAGNPMIKIYRDANGKVKGDARITFLKEESVMLAVDLMDGAFLRDKVPLTVEKAQFQMKGTEFQPKKKQKLDPLQAKLMRKLADQRKKLSWAEEGDDGKGLRIIILKRMFTLEEARESETFYDDLRLEVGAEIESKCGPIEKLTVFEGNPEGPIAVKFINSASADKCVELMNGRYFGGRTIECIYFDGKTNYKVKESDEETEKRLKEFGDWIESADDTKPAATATADTPAAAKEAPQS